MRLAARLGWPATVAVIVLAVLLTVSRLSTSRAVAIWIVLVTALALMVLTRRSRESSGAESASRFEQALRRPKPPTAQPVELLRMERELLIGVADADHAHRRLLPLLRAAASARLAAGHGFEFERRPESARALLGEDAWELLRPDRPEPEDRHGPGVPQRQIAAVIERLEAL
jgi:hypothetical protein